VWLIQSPFYTKNTFIPEINVKSHFFLSKPSSILTLTLLKKAGPSPSKNISHNFINNQPEPGNKGSGPDTTQQPCWAGGITIKFSTEMAAQDEKDGIYRIKVKTIETLSHQD